MPKLSEVFPSFEFPTREREHWKYTPMQKLRDAEFTIDATRATADRLCDNNSLTKELSSHPFATLALQMVDEIKIIEIKESLSLPIQMSFSCQANKAVIKHQRIHIAENIQAEIIFDYTSADDSTCFSNILTEIIVEKNAQLSVYKKQSLNQQSFLIEFIVVEQAENSSFYSFTLDKGAALSRTDFLINLNGQQASTNLQGVYLTANQQIADHHSVIHHHVPHCHSKQHYRGILRDQSKAIFNGKIVIEKNAQKSVTQQLNKNLLLSNQAEIDTKPELEIYADDVKASHGATVGQLDQQALFYLQARGIFLEEARALLMHGFIEEVLLSIKNKKVRNSFVGAADGHSL